MSSDGKHYPLNFSESSMGQQPRGRPLAIEKRFVRFFLKAMNHAPIAMRLWDGERIFVCDGEPEVCLYFRTRRALWGVLTDPELHFGDAYSDGSLEVEGDLYRCVELANENTPGFLQDDGWLGRITQWLARQPRPNSLTGSKKNIHHHYDLSNDFYRLWLDEEYLQYTCAYYTAADVGLEQAQKDKLHHICRKLRLRPEDTVIEAGCGWGGLALFMAKEYGAKVRAYNISREQIRYARARAQEEGVSDRVEYVEDDYRNATGQCDVFASVGMLEHVGVSNYHALGAVIDRCLKPNGRGFIHSIGRNRPRMMNRWIEKRIFPGAYPPTLSEMAEIFEPYQFSVLDVENLRLHYAHTLEDWLERFEGARSKVLQMFDDRFYRAWCLYLVGSITAFRRGELQLFQVVFNRNTNNDIPWSREHIYRP